MFERIKEDLFFKKQNDLRLGEWVSSIESLDQLSKGGVLIAGYPDDEGIKLNGGRLGASQAPCEIRRIFYRMTAYPQLPPLYDRGDLKVKKLALKTRHQEVRTLVFEALEKNLFVMGLGGGHDYAYGDGAGFLNYHHQKKPLIINVDAHLDVRDLTQGLSSGTPFYRLLSDFSNFDLIELGIQRFCNTPEHIKWCERKNVSISYLDDYEFSWTCFSKRFHHLLKEKRPTYLSIDIDAFSSSYAMGASQSWPSGLTPREFFPLYKKLLKYLEVQVLGIYEVSPPLDHDHLTCKLTSELMYSFLESKKKPLSF